MQPWRLLVAGQMMRMMKEPQLLSEVVKFSFSAWQILSPRCCTCDPFAKNSVQVIKKSYDKLCIHCINIDRTDFWNRTYNRKTKYFVSSLKFFLCLERRHKSFSPT